MILGILLKDNIDFSNLYITTKGDTKWLNTNFLKIPLETFPIITLLSTLVLGVVYCYTLKEFFKIFISENVFSKSGLKKIYHFLYVNIFIIILTFIISIINTYTSHFRLGNIFFASIFIAISYLIYLYIDIYKKGYKIKQENDLTI